ncbi:unnamed protein product [Chrysodeixis includens]|uniref:Peptidase M14 domain-containing protein n=1 Tax=Chrysodeixis includens TaxID=689277 RepID=A0A9N8Q2J2_CHRIL|nr:unnamed protein product [Chrysodeixis includens]
MALNYVVFLALLGAAAAGIHDQHSGSSVHGVVLKDKADQKVLYELEIGLGVDVWQRGMPGHRDARVMVTPDKRLDFLDELDSKGIEHYLYLRDVAKALEEEDKEIARWMSTRTNRMIFQGYQRHDEINEYLETIAERHSNVVTLVTAAQSFEGRDIKYLKISTTNFNDESKPIIFMSAMLHAREWVTTPVTLYSIHRLVDNVRHEDFELRDDVDWIILPVINPDGYEYSHTDNRMWRKTRSHYPAINDTCYGVDGNRNFDVYWNTFGVSSDPCSDVYPGHEPFSEVETRVVRDILQEYVPRIQIFMDHHSFGNYILFCNADSSLPPNAAQIHHVGAAMGARMDALKIPKAPYYRVGNSANMLGAASGASDDFAQISGVPMSYTTELPGYEYGFRVPPDYMDQINEEMWHGIAEAGRLAKLYYASRYVPPAPAPPAPPAPPATP